MAHETFFNNFLIWSVLVSTIAIPPRAGVAQPNNQRWRHLILSVVCMIMIANLQYGWSVFVLPLQKARGWSVSDIQIAFTIFVALETWATPINGWIADKLGPDVGPRTVMGVGGVLVGLGWIINSYASSLPALYIGGALSGLGSGAVYCTAVGTAVKWFKDHRGLAVGLVAGGFGAGAALTIIPIQMVMRKRLRIRVPMVWVDPGWRCAHRLPIHSKSASGRSTGKRQRQSATDQPELYSP